MNILYISALPKTRSGGPRYSVPQQIAAQAAVDNVYWININKNRAEGSEVKCNLLEKAYKFRLKSLEPPFNNPDLVIFEGVYYLEFCLIAFKLRRRKIPYIVIPRSSLTGYAQRVNTVKKKLGNLLLFNHFIKGAAAVQYLTEAEYISSSDKWNSNHIIIPNGVKPRKRFKTWEGDLKGPIKGIFIGRMNMYHKGLDYLIEACIQLKEELREYKCSIDLYGPDRSGAKEILTGKIIENGLEGIVAVKEEIHGSEKEKVLLESDFFILTSRFEGHPMGLIEALAYGLPCLVTKGTNMAEEIEGQDAGWTAAINLDSIVKAFKTLFREKEKFPEKGQNALLLSRKYDWTELAKAARREYNRLLT